MNHTTGGDCETCGHWFKTQRYEDQGYGDCPKCSEKPKMTHQAAPELLPAPSPYGYCPLCGAKGKMRERRMDGDDIGECGHKYPSRLSVTRAAQPPNQDCAELEAVKDSLTAHVGYSLENKCWFVRYYPFETEEAARQHLARQS